MQDTKRKPDTPRKQRPSILKWKKLTDSDKSRYTQLLSEVVFANPSPLSDFHCDATCICKNVQCDTKLQDEYDHLIKCFKIADQCLPRFRPGTEKDWWTDDLTRLRNKSKDIHSIWISQGRPRQGPTHTERLRVRADYKRAIRAAQRAPKQKTWDRLHYSLAENDTKCLVQPPVR